MGDAAGEGVLHHREADQHHDQHQAAEQRRPDDVVGDDAGHRRAGGDRPHHHQEPGRDQQHRAVEAVGGEIDHQAEAEQRHRQQRQPRDAGRDRRIDQRERDQEPEDRKPADRDVRIAHVPAVEVEIGEQEHQQRSRQHRFAGRAPDLLGARRHVEHLAPETEVDADIDQHRPAQRGGGREHHAALHHEQDGEEEREQARDADHDAVVERDAVDLVLVGVRLPQIDLRQLVGAQLHHVGHHRAGIERDAVDVGAGRDLTLGTIAARRDRHHARQAEIGPQQSRAHQPVVRNDDQPVDLLVAGIGEREHRPIEVALARAHVHALHDAVRPGRGRHQDAVAARCDGARPPRSGRSRRRRAAPRWPRPPRPAAGRPTGSPRPQPRPQPNRQGTGDAGSNQAATSRPSEPCGDCGNTNGVG